MASDLRLATPEAKTAFLFNRVGLAGCDMSMRDFTPLSARPVRQSFCIRDGPCARMKAFLGIFNRVVAPEDLEQDAISLAERIASGPTFGFHDQDHAGAGMVDEHEQAIEAEAQAQVSACRRISSAPMTPLSQKKTSVRGKLMSDRTYLNWPFLTITTGNGQKGLKKRQRIKGRSQ